MNFKAILEASEDLNKSVLLQNQLQNPLFNYNKVIPLLQKIIDYKEESRHIRVFVENAGKKYGGEHIIDTNPPQENEKLEDYTERIFKNKRFGIILNRVEKWDDRFLKQISETFQPLFQNFPPPCYSYEITLFVGNYRFTPFGVHVDDEFERSVHLNLGPNNREIVIWEKDLFIKITGDEKIFFEPYKIYKNASFKYTLTPRDIFILKGDEYHIGGNNGLAVGLAIAIQKSNQRKLNEAVLETVNDKLVSNLQILNTSVFGLEEILSLDQLGYYQASLKKIEQETLQQITSEALDDYSYKLLSNNGFITPPVSPLKQFENNQSFYRCKPFKILIRRKKETVSLFARGRKISIKYKKEIVSIVKALNSTYLPFTAETIASSSRVDINLTVLMIKLFYECGIVKYDE